MASVVQVTLELKGPSGRYAPLFTYLQQYPWMHYMSGTWFIETTKEPAAIAKDIRPFLLTTDFLFVTPVRAPYVGTLPQAGWDWLNTRIYGKILK